MASSAPAAKRGALQQLTRVSMCQTTDTSPHRFVSHGSTTLFHQACFSHPASASSLILTSSLRDTLPDNL